MMTRYCFIEADSDGERKRWRLAVDDREYVTLADEDLTLKRADVIANGDRISNSFTTEHLLAAVAPEQRYR
jgi:hypothetical protein